MTRTFNALLSLVALALWLGCGGSHGAGQGTGADGANASKASVPQVLVASTDRIYSFLEDVNTGVLTPASGSPLQLSPGLPLHCAITPDNNFLLVARNTNTLSSFVIDGQTGAVKPASTLSTTEFPAAVAETGGALIYVATGGSLTQTPNVIGVRMDSTSGSLQPLGVILSNALWETITVAPNGRFLYAADPVGRFLGYHVDPNTAALTAVPGMSPMTGTVVQQGFGFSPDGNYLLAMGHLTSPNLETTPAEFVLQVDANTGALTPIAGSPFTPPLVPDYFVLHPGGRFAYGITNHAALTFFALDSSYALQVIDTVAVPANPVALTFDRNGSFLYVLSRAYPNSGGTDALTTYQFDSVTGRLHAVGGPYAVPFSPVCVLTR